MIHAADLMLVWRTSILQCMVLLTVRTHGPMRHRKWYRPRELE